MSKIARSVLWFLLITVLFLLYLDYWQWNKVEPLVFGWMPWHVFWQVLLNLALAVAFTLFSKFHWPKDTGE